jgi:peptide chain release factor 1
MDKNTLLKLEKLAKEYEELNTILSQPDAAKNRQKYQENMKRHNYLFPIIEKYKNYCKINKEKEETEKLLKDDNHDREFTRLIEEELKKLKSQEELFISELKGLLNPKKEDVQKNNLILEIRAGAGGGEAAIFARDLFNMYLKYCENKNWKIEILSSHATTMNGLKEIIANIKGQGAYDLLQFESGVHRVQRVPITESQGRVHTSTISVAVLPEVEDIEIKIDPQELKIDVFRSSGPGGQSVNTTDSAVRITHLPTNIMVQCQDEKSQHKNKSKAMKILKARIMNHHRSQQENEISENRRKLIGSADRSEKIRTYNFPQNRITDHRINLTLHKLETIIKGDLDELTLALQNAYKDSE